MNKSNKKSSIEDLIQELLINLDEDPKREGLLKNPERVARAYKYFTKGYKEDVVKIINGAVFKEKNQEMVSALTAAIWSGSWFISSIIFKVLRQSGIAYVYIFLITAALYALGVVWYYALIVDYTRREKAGLI